MLPGGTNLSVRSPVSVLGRLQDIAVELRVGEAADVQAATTRHQHLLVDNRRETLYPSDTLAWLFSAARVVRAVLEVSGLLRKRIQDAAAGRSDQQGFQRRGNTPRLVLTVIISSVILSNFHSF